MRAKILILGLVFLFLISCEKTPQSPFSPELPPIDKIQNPEENPGNPGENDIEAIEIIGEPELFFTCYAYESSFETFDFSVTIKNVSDKLVTGCTLKLIIYGEESQGEWDYLVFHQWDMLTGAGMMPGDILPGEERIVTTLGWHSIPIGKAGGIDMCERMRDGNAEFRFEAYF